MSDLQNRFVIDDSNYLSQLSPYVDGSQVMRGLVPRDYSAAPRGVYASSDPKDIPLIPRSEWPELIKEMTEKKSRLSDIRRVGNYGQHIPALDQNGQGYCTTEDTEVLTDKGWVFWPDYNGSDLLGTVNTTTGNMEFQKPLQRQVFEYSGEMIYSTNRRIDFGVTPNHRMLVNKFNVNTGRLNNHFEFVEAKDMGWYCGLPHAPKGFLGLNIEKLSVPNDREYTGDDFVALLGLIISDGYAGGTENTKNWVSFASFREELRQDIAELATRNGFHESPSRKGVWVRYDAGAFAEWTRQHCYTSGVLGAGNKKLPLFLKEVSQRQMQIFLHYFDDRNRDGSQYYSSSKKLIDDLQEIHLKLGKRSHIGKRDPKTSKFDGNKSGTITSKLTQYVLTVGQEDRLSIMRSKHIETDRYKGNVFCATVPNGTLVTRRNGSVLISGNCWAYSTTAAVQILRAAHNMPYVPLSAHSVACVIKDFRDQGGWGALSLDYIREKGVVPQSLWPAKSMSRQYNTSSNWEEAKKYRVTEGWYDLSESVYDRDLTFDQVMTLLLSRVPVVLDFYWWGHSVCGFDPVDFGNQYSLNDPERWGIDIMNSWRDAWGNTGMGIVRGRKAIPDGAVAPRAVVVS